MEEKSITENGRKVFVQFDINIPENWDIGNTLSGIYSLFNIIFCDENLENALEHEKTKVQLSGNFIAKIFCSEREKGSEIISFLKKEVDENGAIFAGGKGLLYSCIQGKNLLKGITYLLSFQKREESYVDQVGDIGVPGFHFSHGRDSIILGDYNRYQTTNSDGEMFLLLYPSS